MPYSASSGGCGSQGDARLLDPSRGLHLLKEAKSTLNQRPVLLRIVAPAEATVSQQRLREFGRTLDVIADLKAVAERDVGLRPIAHRFVDLPENSMSSYFFETEGPALRHGKCFANGA